MLMSDNTNIETGYETIKFTKDGGRANVTLNRPEVINAYNIQMRDELFQILEACQLDPDVRVIVLRGEGPRGFCAGADLSEFGSAPSVAIAREVRWQRDVWTAFLELDKPIICVMHGHTIGSGIEMALLCDIRIAAESTIFRMPEAYLGLLPAAGGSQTLPRYVGESPALDMLLSNRAWTADQGLKAGIVSDLVPDSEINALVNYYADYLQSMDPGFIRLLKRSIHGNFNLSLDQGLSLEIHCASQRMADMVRVG